MIETIQQAVKPHDKHQIEVKLDYELAKARQTRYQISTYIFVPQNLGINRSTYDSASFYQDVQNYIRLKTPSFTLKDFTENSASPLTTLERILNTENWAGHQTHRTRLLNSLKLLSAMLKSAIRDHLNLIQRRIDNATPDTKIPLLIRDLVEAYVAETQKITIQYRTFYSSLNLPNIDSEIFTAYRFTDESLSILIEENAVELFQIVDTHLKRDEKKHFKEQLSECVNQEREHRKSHGYPSVLALNGNNEEYAFRTSVLKKYASSVLYLSTTIRREGAGVEHILYAVAAGLSMIFATVVAFYFQSKFGNFTFPFFISLVVGYMFKDRIKETGRAIFAGYLQNTFYDRRIVIRTQDGRHKLGILKENMSFVQEKDLPKDAIKARNRDPLTELDNDGLGENIICHSKEIILYNHVFKIAFNDLPGISGINDIIRYDLQAYLKRMGDPKQKRPYLQDGQIKQVTYHKVYHLNFVTRYRAKLPQKMKLYKRVRLILDRAGIKRMEQVPL